MRRRALSVAALGAVLLAAGSTAFAAGCGETTTADLATLRGTWYRVEAGAPNPVFSLVVAAEERGAAVTFVDRSEGTSQTVAGSVDAGIISCALSTTDPALTAPEIDETSPTSPPATPLPTGPETPVLVDLELSIDESSGQLIVDRVLADGTLEPVWLYERADGVTPSP